jgi:hypothetical protein
MPLKCPCVTASRDSQLKDSTTRRKSRGERGQALPEPSFFFEEGEVEPFMRREKDVVDMQLRIHVTKECEKPK